VKEVFASEAVEGFFLNDLEGQDGEGYALGGQVGSDGVYCCVSAGASASASTSTRWQANVQGGTKPLYVDADGFAIGGGPKEVYNEFCRALVAIYRSVTGLFVIGLDSVEHIFIDNFTAVRLLGLDANVSGLGV